MCSEVKNCTTVTSVIVLNNNDNFKDISNTVLAFCLCWVSRGSVSGHVRIKLQAPLLRGSSRSVAGGAMPPRHPGQMPSEGADVNGAGSLLLGLKLIVPGSSSVPPSIVLVRADHVSVL